MTALRDAPRRIRLTWRAIPVVGKVGAGAVAVLGLVAVVATTLPWAAARVAIISGAASIALIGLTLLIALVLRDLRSVVQRLDRLDRTVADLRADVRDTTVTARGYQDVTQQAIDDLHERIQLSFDLTRLRGEAMLHRQRGAVPEATASDPLDRP